MRDGQYFRAGVGAIVRNSTGRVLALERSDVAGAWQLPQGGLEEGEEPAEAVFREVVEETGIEQEQLKLVAQAPELLAYELPPDARSTKTGRGQVQYWFVLDYIASSPVRLPDGGEFCDFRWTTMDWLVEEIVGFRRPVYRRLAAYRDW